MLLDLHYALSLVELFLFMRGIEFEGLGVVAFGFRTLWFVPAHELGIRKH